GGRGAGRHPGAASGVSGGERRALRAPSAPPRGPGAGGGGARPAPARLGAGTRPGDPRGSTSHAGVRRRVALLGGGADRAGAGRGDLIRKGTMSIIEQDIPPAELLERLAEKEREVQALRSELERWHERYEAGPKRAPNRAEAVRGEPADVPFTTISGAEVEPLYTPLDRPETAPTEVEYYNERLGLPGEYPYTRGPYGTMYRTRLWTMRQFAGFGTAEETNERYKFLLKRGQTGLSVAFDFPTLMGYDSDHPRSLGEVGKCGVAISSLADMETLFEGIPLDQVSVSMTINGPAIILFCFYMVTAEKQ